MSYLHSPLWANRRVKPAYGAVEIDWTHPLAQGLQIYLPFNEGAGPASVLTAPIGLTVGGAVPAWTVQSVGLGQIFPTTRYYYSTSTPITAAPLTLAAWFRESLDGTSQTIVALNASANDTNYFSLNAGMATAGDPLRAITTATTAAIATAGTIALNTVSFGAAIFASATSRQAVLNGVAGTVETTSKAPAGINRIGIGTGAGLTLPAAALNGELYGVMAWSRALTLDDLAWVRADPYCFLRPVVRRSYVVLGAAPAGRTTKNTRPYPLGLRLGISRGISQEWTA